MNSEVEGNETEVTSGLDVNNDNVSDTVNNNNNCEPLIMVNEAEVIKQHPITPDDQDQESVETETNDNFDSASQGSQGKTSLV